MHFETWQWALAIVAAVLIGVSKTGIAGVGMLIVVIFAQIMPAKQATGIVLPLLCFGDFVAVASYRQHTQWRFLWRLFPWTAAGVVIGYFALRRIDDRETRLLVGALVVALVGLHVARRLWNGRKAERKQPAIADERVLVGEEYGWWFAPFIGVLAGFTTLVANAAGPLMVIYLLAVGLPKMEFVGTGAVFFMLLNLFKVPFMVHLGLISAGSFKLNLLLAPAVFVGALLGRKVLARTNQKLFENLALGLSALAGIKLLF